MPLGAACHETFNSVLFIYKFLWNNVETTIHYATPCTCGISFDQWHFILETIFKLKYSFMSQKWLIYTITGVFFQKYKILISPYILLVRQFGSLFVCISVTPKQQTDFIIILYTKRIFPGITHRLLFVSKTSQGMK